MPARPHRTQWTDEMYEAAIGAVSDKIAKLVFDPPHRQLSDLRLAAQALRRERVLLDYRSKRRKPEPITPADSGKRPKYKPGDDVEV